MKLKTDKVESELYTDYFLKFPKDAAHTLDTFSADIVLQYLKELPAENARAIFFQLNSELITELLLEIDDELFKELFFKVNTHLAARLFSSLEKDDVTSKLALLTDIVSREILDFLNFKEDTAGYLMETDMVTFHADNVVDDVLTRIRKIGKKNIMVIYIVDEEGKLLGKVPIQYIAISAPNEKLESIMKAAPFIDAMVSREEVLEAIEKEDLLQIPVTDINHILLGIIRNDTLMSASKQEITENLQSMFGAGKEEQALSKWTFAVKKRLPWLQVNLATAFLASMVVGLFEETIAKITILAIFLPVVAGQSGNTGSQALAVTIRGLALKEIRISQWFRVAKKEIMVGFVNGVAVALTTGIIVYFWTSSLGIGIVIAISMVISMLIAGFAGAIIPIGLKAIGQDPATSSSIILTTVTDICGFLSFLGLASALSSVLGIV
ncbi:MULTISPECIES: magnesium transporter [unclassified Polaribacter]|uniref:magnesium transporter n=1 Tax=unclassified Polaribacter TaxID=196858 RepID=UPI0011BD5F28|nr:MULTISPECIES: magnesium transporter [unclassified Polaribacter]TXD52949.1 magnesium transporter [Polaribacter sp. IC063]TXD60960.1 magnesium transporter [Polaribacter sp. IC066]